MSHSKKQDPLTIALARLAYEAMVLRVRPDADWSICAWHVQPLKLQEDWIAAIGKLREAASALGYVVVPKEPTGSMIEAGAQTFGIHTPHIGDLPKEVIDGQPSKAWRAMVEESEK